MINPEGSPALYYNIAKCTVQQYYGVLKYQRHFMLSNLPNLYKKYDVQISKGIFTCGKKL
jgi:hypothetical protein